MGVLQSSNTPIVLAAVLVLVVVLILILVLVLVLVVALVLILVLVVVLISVLILVVHGWFLHNLFIRLGRRASLPRFSGSILRLENQTDDKSCKDSGGNATGRCFQSTG